MLLKTAQVYWVYRVMTPENLTHFSNLTSVYISYFFFHMAWSNFAWDPWKKGVAYFMSSLFLGDPSTSTLTQMLGRNRERDCVPLMNTSHSPFLSPASSARGWCWDSWMGLSSLVSPLWSPPHRHSYRHAMFISSVVPNTVRLTLGINHRRPLFLNHPQTEAKNK